MGRGRGRLRDELRRLCGLACRGRATVRHPAGRPPRAGMSAAAARDRESPAGPDGNAGCGPRIVCREMTGSPSLKLLLSSVALRTWGARIKSADAGLSFVTAEDALAA